MNFLATSSYNYDTVANEVVRYACAMTVPFVDTPVQTINLQQKNRL